jgi:hypothetical protein
MKADKIARILDRVRYCVQHARYYDTRHATDRQTQRAITRPEILHVLTNGRHEQSKDTYQERYRSWNYAIRGRTIDRRDVRVIVSFDDNNMLIITAIEVGK